jgi:hypothetical protein
VTTYRATSIPTVPSVAMTRATESRPNKALNTIALFLCLSTSSLVPNSRQKCDRLTAPANWKPRKRAGQRTIIAKELIKNGA